MKFCLMIFMTFSVCCNSWALQCLKAAQRLKLAKGTALRTPCPLFNGVLDKMVEDNVLKPDCDRVKANDFMLYAGRWGIDPKLLKMLAKRKTDSEGYIHFALLNDPDEFPRHNGSMAIPDPNATGTFVYIDEDRLNILRNDSRFSTEINNHGKVVKYISYKQLRAYQREHCWAQSKMGCMDKAAAKAERHFLWKFLGAYRIKNKDNVDVLPLDLVVNGLQGKFPQPFSPNLRDKATRWSTVKALIIE